MALNMEAQYARALQIGKTPQGFALLKQAALGQNDDFDQVVANMALKQLTKTKTAAQGQQAAQQLANKQTVAQKNVQAADHALPEMSGIGQLPAPNMEALAAAQGGVVGYADGGAVGYAGGGRVPTWEDVLAAQQQWKDSETPWYLPTPASDPSAGAQARYKQVMAAYEGKKPLDFLAPLPSTAPAAAPSADNRIKAPQKVKDALATVSQPAVPVQNPTKEQKETLVEKYKGADELYNFISDKFKGQLDPIKDQLAKDREDYKTMKSENVGLALLGAAGALLKPGRSTASAIGEGLGTLAEYGSKFQPQLLAARQGISSGEIGLAQAEAQAARGNFATAMQADQQNQARALQERELAMKERYYGKMGDYYGAAAGAKSGAGGLTPALQLRVQQQAAKAWEDHLKSNINAVKTPAAREAFIAQETQRILSGLGYGGGSNLNAGFIGGKDVTGKAYRSSLFDD